MPEWGKQKTGFTRTKEGNGLDQAIESVRTFYDRKLEDSEIRKITNNYDKYPDRDLTPSELMSTFGGKRKSRKQKKSLKRKSRKARKSHKKRR